MDFASLADFHAAARHGSFSEAARKSDVPKATISRRIRGLEASLGVRLFKRGPRSLRLTEEGQALLSRTASLLEELAEVGNHIAGGAGRPRGRLRVSVPGLFACEHFGAFAARFVARYPEVKLEAYVQDDLVDLYASDFDAVIRVNPDPSSPLVGRRLFAQPILVVAAPSLPRPSQDGAGIAAVTLLSWPTVDEWACVTDDGHVVLRPRPVMSFSSLLPLCDAVLAGAGAGVLPLSAVRDHLAAGRLVEWGRLADRLAEVWVLHGDGNRSSAKVAALISMLVEEFGDSGPV